MTQIISSKDVVAGNGLLDRRLFLKQGITFSSVVILSGACTAESESKQALSDSQTFDHANPPWMKQPGKAFSTYGQPSSYESDVVRFPSANESVPGNGVSWTPLHQLQGTITPNGLHYERHHNGVPQIDPARHQLIIHGLVETPKKFSVDDLLQYPMRSKICFIECGGNSNAGFNTQPSRSEVGYFHGLVSNAEWTGIPLSVLFEEVGLKPEGKWLVAEGADAFAMNISVPLEKALDDGVLALYQNGERLRPENGYPMRLLFPGWEAVTHVKWVRRLTITEQPIMARNETARYTELQADGKARQFTFVMEAKSLILSPSGGMLLKRPGLYQITGLAWTGNGKISAVEVSADGGKTWAEAELQQPVLDRAFTRFRMPWQWNGEAAILQSRAIDETGYVQPEREQLIAERGRHGFFHYNAIVSWEVDDDGTVTHIYNNEDETTAGDTTAVDIGWD